ncbi:hypothetical protein P280DRAFT_402300 [Massarina eburnea CBS 473.64]|uniref:DUF7082 domain-containing protein n=1 Tax=Massarina eburnea CBS 473.64 TaxID=1395130 RepID=A0A6A6RYT0_9PLEO|nr:hypothetical protein P280DRAFT_402300 [Massarina eburnea CBS 473.64]
MSGYDKSQEQYVYDAEATRPNQAPTYAGIAQPSFASQYTDAPTRLSHEPANVEGAYIPSPNFESRGTGGYQAESSFIDARSRHPVSRIVTESEITKSVSPSQGTSGSTILLRLRTKYDLAAEQPNFAFMFGNEKRVAALQKLDTDDDYYNYALSVQVPPFPLTNSWNPTMMLKLQMEDKGGRILGDIDAGKFTFTDMSPNLAYQSPSEVTKKRKYSSEYGDDAYTDNAAKRGNSLRYQAKPSSMSTAYSAASLSPLPAQASLASSYGYGGGYDLPKQSSYTPQLSQKSLYAVPSGINMPQTEMKPPQMSPSLPPYGSYSSLAHTGRSPSAVSATPSRLPVLPSPSGLSTPILVRATTLPQSAAPPATQSFNPYLMYPTTKAVLKIEGDLDRMAENWTREEREARRRLVEFKRLQQGSTITTKFAPVTPEARPARSICVSCIWWEEKDEYFITSVDTIFLLEQLVNVRFTVEEKNRIRRNLEGFRPSTVSKAKPDSEEFFKVIMGFPNPKPRNIEKDVKVFPWKIVSHALKKIISKYSASYSSTAAAGSLPVGSSSSSSFLPVGISQSGDAHRNTSPRSVASSAASTAYTPIMGTTSLSPNLKTSAGLDRSAAHGLSVSQRGQGMSQWQGSAHHQVPQYTTGLSQSGRESWDYDYMNASAGPGVSATAHSMQMQRPEVTPDLSQMPPDHRYQNYGQHTTRI